MNLATGSINHFLSKLMGGTYDGWLETMVIKTDKPIRVGLMSLGCAKNLVDAEIMLGSLLKEGVEITHDASTADVVIVNTCSFIDAAQEESVDAILEAAALRDSRNPGQGLIVSGCLPQRFRDELPKLLPEVDAFMGIDQVAQVAQIVRDVIARRALRRPSLKAGRTRAKAVAGLRRLNAARGAEPAEQAEKDTVRGTQSGPSQDEIPESLSPAGPLVDVNLRPHYIPDYATPRFRLTPAHFAYVKIAEGCNHPCSFCIIPRMRGSHRSRLQTDVISEAEALLLDGVKELNLISQDSTYYGLDLREGQSRAISSPEKFNAAARALPSGSTTLSTLVKGLNALPGEFWIRLLYTHPAHWTDELIETLGACQKVARYVDIPLQHIHESMLERMRRETTQEYIVGLIRRIRKGIPGIALRTTFIVGFPGETEAYFETLLQFVRETRFERLGVFTYSHEGGTRASKMGRQISDSLKKERRDRVMAAQLEVSRQAGAGAVGRTLRVLVEGEASAKELQQANISSWEHGLLRNGEQDEAMARLKGRFSVGRGEADAPDIDGRVYVRGKLPKGAFARVKVIGSTDYDLIAELA